MRLKFHRVNSVIFLKRIEFVFPSSWKVRLFPSLKISTKWREEGPNYSGDSHMKHGFNNDMHINHANVGTSNEKV